ncbi:hypothetical protein LZ32DRAFT_101586 [Colletotrichum eremochloae]|uniref:Uncharacterized protein n=1 Tax=Colletotrichum sublineola TaxID=1173701 RepID=A0A066X513_COLSU|nr:hypothetical protein LY78DRAFT_733859 [Colletotrichum sublineola]KAK2006359.1 hypothetical protein LZ32DRAFT_101586 [Colletotrichum eremochloae]KDN62754.1 hypothetical protein CSUB01_05658 [Colletotrichum sublineola]
MGLLNPVYAIIVPFLFLFTVPLAIFAGITTTLAFTVLIFRVILVYFDLALSLLPSYITGRPQYLSYTSKSPTSGSPSPSLTPTRRSASRRTRRPSSASAVSVGTITPISENGGLGLFPSVGIDRDYEGVGGWRLGSGNDDELWMTINSRLELPDRQYQRHHHRSPSGGPTTPGGGEGYLMMKGGRNRSPESNRGGFTTIVSPNSSRARTPTNSHIAFTALDGVDGDYFPSMSSPKTARKVAVA